MMVMMVKTCRPGEDRVDGAAAVLIIMVLCLKEHEERFIKVELLMVVIRIDNQP